MTGKTTIRTLLVYRLSDEKFDSQIAVWVCSIAGVAIVPLAIRALMRHPGGRADFLLGVVLASVTGLLIVMLGLVSRHRLARLDQVPRRRCWPEFIGYVGCLGLMIGCISALPALGLSPVGITVALLAICSLSLSLLLAGMMTTVFRAPERKE
jgi:hypothetical protein